MTKRSGLLNNRPNILLDKTDLAEIQAEARRLDAPLSWVVQQAWRIARGRILAEGDAIAAARATPPAPGSAPLHASAPQPSRAARPPEHRPARAPEPPPQEPAHLPASTHPAEPLDHQERELWLWGEPTM